MMNIRLKERREEKLSELKITDTFKIIGSSFIFMKMDVDGLTVRPMKLPQAEDAADPKPIKVLIPEDKVPVICLNSGKTQFLNLEEKVQIVDFDAIEIIKEKESE